MQNTPLLLIENYSLNKFACTLFLFHITILLVPLDALDQDSRKIHISNHSYIDSSKRYIALE